MLFEGQALTVKEAQDGLYEMRFCLLYTSDAADE